MNFKGHQMWKIENTFLFDSTSGTGYIYNKNANGKIAKLTTAYRLRVNNSTKIISGNAIKGCWVPMRIIDKSARILTVMLTMAEKPDAVWDSTIEKVDDAELFESVGDIGEQTS